MPWVEAFSDAYELRRCIRDLVALSALPAIWKDHDPNQIANSVAAALVAMLDADFVYLLIPDRQAGPLVEILRAGNTAAAETFERIRAVLRDSLTDPTAQRQLTIANPGGKGSLRLAHAPIGFGGGAVICAGSRRNEFPTETQQLLLQTAANETTVAAQRWQANADKHRFVSLIERSSDFIGIATLDGSPQYVNPAGLKHVGLSGLERLSPLSFLEFIVPKERRRVRDELWPIVVQDGRWSGEINFRHFQTEAAIPFLVDCFRIDDPRTGQPMNVATVSRDLSVQKHSEAQLLHLAEGLEQRVAERTAELAESNCRLIAEIAERERADARLQLLQLEFFHAARFHAAGHMAAALAHELNQPLTAVINSVNAARRLIARENVRRSDSKVAKIMDEALEQALRAGQIIRRLHDFLTRGEAEKRVEDVVPMIEDASELALTGSRNLGVKVRFSFDPGAARVLVDRTQIQQVLINLMRNAVEAMAASDRRELEVRTALVNEETVEIAVADSGPGLSREVADHLFEPFISTKRNGMGLGLSICRSIVEAHGGKLWTRSDRGAGATFCFTLTAAVTAEGEARVG
jgi:signal transduction histidine kinase